MPIARVTSPSLAAPAGAALLTGNNLFTGDQRITGKLGINRVPTARQPISLGCTLDAAATGAEDKVAIAITPTITGDYTGSTGSNAGFVWGINAFVNTGNQPGDAVVGSQLIGSLFELSIRTPAGSTIPYACGLQVEAAFFGATAGATVTQMESLRVASPKRKDGAGGGVATNAYGLFIESVTTAATGGSSAISLFVQGGVSRFGGRLDVTDQIANSGSGDLSIFAGFSDSDGARLALLRTANGGHARARMATTNAEFQVHDGTTVNWAVTRTGLPKWSIAGNAQTTVGAAGGASALPATPTKYLKVVDSAGTTLVVPAYAAA